jgi:hypothetical protein
VPLLGIPCSLSPIACSNFRRCCVPFNSLIPSIVACASLVEMDKAGETVHAPRSNHQVEESSEDSSSSELSRPSTPGLHKLNMPHRLRGLEGREERKDPIKRMRHYKARTHNVMRCLDHIGPRGRAILEEEKDLEFRGKLEPIPRKKGADLPSDPEFWEEKAVYLHRKFHELDRELRPLETMGRGVTEEREETVLKWLQLQDVADWNEVEGLIADYIEKEGTPPEELVDQIRSWYNEDWRHRSLDDENGVMRRWHDQPRLVINYDDAGPSSQYASAPEAPDSPRSQPSSVQATAPPAEQRSNLSSATSSSLSAPPRSSLILPPKTTSEGPSRRPSPSSVPRPALSSSPSGTPSPSSPMAPTEQRQAGGGRYHLRSRARTGRKEAAIEQPDSPNGRSKRNRAPKRSQPRQPPKQRTKNPKRKPSLRSKPRAPEPGLARPEYETRSGRISRPPVRWSPY